MPGDIVNLSGAETLLKTGKAFPLVNQKVTLQVATKWINKGSTRK